MRSSFRGFSKFLTGAAFVAFAFLAPTCQPSGGDFQGPSNEGGDEQTGGRGDGGSNMGGSSEQGGSSGSNNGGSSNSGGSSEKGGSGGSNNGGSSSKGGSNSGGSASGGSGGGNGGTSSSNGGTSSGNGGTVTSGTKNTGTTVTFEKGKAKGAMTGYGWVAMGKLDSVTDPTCGPSETPITSTTACASDPNWSATDKLCITGGCPALPASPTSQDYADNYGIVVGVNAGHATTGDPSLVLGQTFKTITVAASGMPSSEVRIQIHKKGDPDSTSYCIKYSSSAVDLTKFAIDCYNTSPTELFPAGSIPNIDKVSLMAVSGSSAVTVSSMCITGITFGT